MLSAASVESQAVRAEEIDRLAVATAARTPSIAGMGTLSEDIRAWIVDGMDRRGWTKAELARRARLKPATIGAIVGGVEIQRPGDDKIAAIESAFGEKFTRKGVNSGPSQPPPLSGPGGESRAVPIVLASRFPTHARGVEMLELLRYSAHLWRFSSVQDPLTFGVQLEVPAFGFRLGDQLLFSPATRPAPGKFVAFVMGERLAVGEYVEIEGLRAVRDDSGGFHKDPEILGTAVDLWRAL